MKLTSILKKYNDLEVPVKASIWFVVCNILLKGISFITVPIFTRLMPDDQYGLLSIYMSYEEVIITLATWNIALSAYLKGLFKYKSNIRFFTTSAQLLSNLITVGFFSIIFIFRKNFFALTGLSSLSVVALFTYTLLQPAYNCWLTEMRTKYRYKRATLMTLFYSVINVAIPMAAILLIARTAEVKYVATLLGSGLLFLFFYLRNANYAVLLQDRSEVWQQWKFIIKYQIPIVIHGLSYTILAQSDRIMIGRMVGNAQAAYYSVAYNLAFAISLIQNAIGQTLVPWRFEQLEKKNYGRIRQVTDQLLLGIAAIVLLFVLVAPEIMKLMFTDEYYEAVWSIPPIALSVFLIFVYSMFVWVKNYFEKTVYVGVISAFCAGINILLNYLMIGKFGYIVCGYTTAASYLLCCVAHYIAMIFVCKQCGVPEPIYNGRNILLIGAALSVSVILITLLYPHAIIRYVLFAALSVVVLYFARRIYPSFMKKSV